MGSSPNIKQDEHETLETLFRNIDLSIAEQQLIGCYHTTGPGRPPRSPIGILRALIVMRMKGIRSLRELTRILDVDRRIRRLCLITDKERGYTKIGAQPIHQAGSGPRGSRLIIEEKVDHAPQEERRRGGGRGPRRQLRQGLEHQAPG